MSFNIQEYVVFDRSGRAFCPSCALKKGRRPSQKSLAVLPSGAYKCHAGCTPDEIRRALGQSKQVVPMDPYRQKSMQLMDQDLKWGVESLLTSQNPNGLESRRWLEEKGITAEMIRHFRLGLVGDSISIPIPVDERGNSFYLKRRISPWTGSKAWSQKGIPAMVYFTHKPEGASQTWLCEGEWDAILLGWKLYQEGIQEIAVATFTCGCNGVPKKEELDRLPGVVTVFYDLDDPGKKGAYKVARALKPRGRIAEVPSVENPPGGWDISNALHQGFTLEDLRKAAEEAVFPEEEIVSLILGKPANVSYLQAMEEVERILAIEDPGERLWELASFSKQTPFTTQLLQKIFTERQHTQVKFAPVDVQETINQQLPERQWLIGSHISFGTVVLLYADGGVGKSLLAYDLTKAVALGSPWNGFPVKQARVLIIQTDEPEIDTCERLRIARFEEIGTEKVYIERNWQFSQMQKLKQWVAEYQPGLIIIDSFTSCNRFSELEEKDMTYALGLLDLGQLASEFNCSVLILHHENKLGGVRGSTAIRNSVSEVWHLRKGEPKENLPLLQRVLEIEKSRSGCNCTSIIELDPEDNSWTHHGEMGADENGTQPLSTRLLNYLNDHRGTWFEPEELTHEFANTSRDQIRKALERWRRQGVLRGEDRLKRTQTGATRYKVYASAHLSENLSSVAQTQSQQSFSTLDMTSTSDPRVQRVEPAPSKDHATLDTPDRQVTYNPHDPF